MIWSQEKEKIDESTKLHDKNNGIFKSSTITDNINLENQYLQILIDYLINLEHTSGLDESFILNLSKQAPYMPEKLINKIVDQGTKGFRIWVIIKHYYLF